LAGAFTRNGMTPQRIEALGLQDSVRCVGYLSEEALRVTYRMAEALVFCSLSEGFGLPLLEAMASGLPIVTSNVGATGEVAAGSAVLVDPYSVDSIAEGLWTVLSSDSLRRQLITKGLERAQAFTWEATARKTLDVYRAVSV